MILFSDNYILINSINFPIERNIIIMLFQYVFPKFVIIPL